MKTKFFCILLLCLKQTNNEIAPTFALTSHFSNVDFSLSVQLGVKKDQPKFYVDYSGEGIPPLLILEVNIYFSFYQWMKNGWKGSAKGRLVFSPKLLLNNMQLQTWKAHPEESRMFHNLQRWRKGSTIVYKIWHVSAVHSRDISGSINSSTLPLKLNLLDDDVRTYNDYVEDGCGGGGRKCLEEGGLQGAENLFLAWSAGYPCSVCENSPSCVLTIDTLLSICDASIKNLTKTRYPAQAQDLSINIPLLDHYYHKFLGLR